MPGILPHGLDLVVVGGFYVLVAVLAVLMIRQSIREARRDRYCVMPDTAANSRPLSNAIVSVSTQEPPR